MKRWDYSPHPTVAYTQAIIENLKEKTGNSLDEWLNLLDDQRGSDKKSVVTLIKTQHKLGGTTANIIAEHLLDLVVEYNPHALLEAQYSAKPNLVPLLEQLMGLAAGLGGDVRFSPTKTFVPIYRNNVVVQIKPTTKKRIDLGLALGDKLAEGILIDTGGAAKGDRITHRIAITDPSDITDEVAGWMRVAYERDAR